MALGECLGKRNDDERGSANRPFRLEDIYVLKITKPQPLIMPTPCRH